MAYFEIFWHLFGNDGVNSQKFTILGLLNRGWNLGPPEYDAGVPHTVPHRTDNVRSTLNFRALLSEISQKARVC
jgi:hypothetical protein